MERDLRIYQYTAGGLHKVSIRHRHKTIQSCREALKYIKKRSDSQFIIVEYTDKYDSKIIYVTPIDLAQLI